MLTKKQAENLGKTTATVGSLRFATGKPVVFPYVHNTAMAPRRIRGAADTFQQSVEPAGFYMLLDFAPDIETRGWVKGVASFRSPLVLRFGPGGYDNNSWKARLSRAYGGKKGAALTRAILASGHDAIVTVDSGGEPAEIISLTRV